MSSLELLQVLSWLLYVIVFVLVLVRTIRRPTPAHVDMTLFFGAIAILVCVSTLTSRLHLVLPTWLVTDITGAAAMALGYLLLRLVADFSDVPTWLMRVVEVGMVIAILAIVVLPTPVSPLISLLLVAYLVLVISYDTWAFARQASRTRGVTHRRMQAAAAGSLCLALALVAAGLGVGLPQWAPLWSQSGAALGLASGVCYFVGFAPPTWLRRAWQEPEVRAFLALAARLPRLPELRMIVRELERRAADVLGAPGASVALWDPDTSRLRVFDDSDLVESPRPTARSAALSTPSQAGVLEFDPVERPVTGRAFLEQRPTLVMDAALADPDNLAIFELRKARTVLSAPITSTDRRLGVLAVYAPSSPVFANSDLELLQLLADQAAVILESRAFIEQAARVQAREEAARLKEDFLSSAAHDLKTPVTGMVTQAQVLQRRATRDPQAPVDRPGVDRLVEQSLRLKSLVLELLDVSGLENGRLVGELEDADLRAMVQTIVARDPSLTNRIELDADQPVFAAVDPPRFQQVLSNLLENAVKYSAYDSPVRVRVWSAQGEARLSVRDVGIGIPTDDLPLVFERFHRARNVDDRRFAGMGLGLYIARGIVQQHGGRIWVESAAGVGSTFHVAVPVAARSRPVTEGSLASA